MSKSVLQQVDVGLGPLDKFESNRLLDKREHVADGAIDSRLRERPFVRLLCNLLLILHSFSDQLRQRFPARNVFIDTPTRGKGAALDEASLWNFAGRAGRLGEEVVGNVFLVNYENWETKPLTERKPFAMQAAFKQTVEADFDAVVELLQAAVDKAPILERDRASGDRIAGFGIDESRMFRMGACHHHDPNATEPIFFHFEVLPGKVSETWAEGLSLFHNPNAVVPISNDMFPGIAHHRYRDGQFRSLVPEFHPYASMTLHFSTKNG